MQFNQQIIVKRWKPTLEEYEKIHNKVPPCSFRLVKNLCLAHHISNKEMRCYYRKWQEGGKRDNSLLSAKRGARSGSRRTPKEIERDIIKAYRRFGSYLYELALLFKPPYLDKTPSPALLKIKETILNGECDDWWKTEREQNIKIGKYKPPLPASCFKKETETSPLIEVTLPALSGPDQGKPWVGVLRRLSEAGYY